MCLDQGPTAFSVRRSYLHRAFGDAGFPHLISLVKPEEIDLSHFSLARIFYISSCAHVEQICRKRLICLSGTWRVEVGGLHIDSLIQTFSRLRVNSKGKGPKKQTIEGELSGWQSIKNSPIYICEYDLSARRHQGQEFFIFSWIMRKDRLPKGFSITSIYFCPASHSPYPMLPREFDRQDTSCWLNVCMLIEQKV